MEMETPKAATETGRLLREWRGEMRLERASVYVSDLLGYEVSREKVRRYETTTPEEDMDPSVVSALVTVYGRRYGELPPYMADRVERIKELFTALSRCTAA